MKATDRDWVIAKLKDIEAHARSAREKAGAKAIEYRPLDVDPHDTSGYRMAAELGTLTAYTEVIADDLESVIHFMTPRRRVRGKR